MVEKKLNLNQPILSVRRHSTTIASQRVDETKKLANAHPHTHRFPPSISEPKSLPVTNPGSIPFLWEQIPGRPKEHLSRQPQNSIAAKTSEAFVDSQSSKESFVLNSNVDANSSLKDPRELKEPVLKYEPRKSRSQHHEEKEKQQSDYQHENLVAICCLLPGSCLKSSVCVLKPVHVTRVTISAANRMQLKSTKFETGELKQNKIEEKKVVGSHKKSLQDLLAADEASRKEMDSKRCISTKRSDESSHEDFNKLNAYKCCDFNVVSSFKKHEMIKHNSFEQNDEDKNVEKQLRRATSIRNSHDKYSEFPLPLPLPLPPPLPKSPSDSWLWRTLPSMSTNKALFHSYLSRATNPPNDVSD